MKITIITGRWAAKFLEHESFEMDVPEQSTVGSVLGMLPLPPDETGMVTIADKAVKDGFLLSDGDSMKIYPVIIGG